MTKRAESGSGSIKKEGNRWRGDIMLGYKADGSRNRVRVSGETRREVRDKLDQAIERHGNGLFPIGPIQTVAQFMSGWLDAVAKTSTEPRTYESYQDIVRLHVLPALGRIELEKLSPQHIQALYAEKLKTLHPNTVRHIHTCLHAALETADRWRLITRNPCDLVKAPKVPRRQTMALDPEQARAFIVALEGDPMEAYWIMALCTGLRPGEMRALHKADVDLEHRTIKLQRAYTRVRGVGQVEKSTKTDEARQIHLIDLAVAAVRRQLLRVKEMQLRAGPRWQDHDLVFPSAKGTPLNESDLYRRYWVPLVERAKLPAIRPYDLRHSFASLLLAAGATPKDVQALLGHANIGQTMDTYGHVFPTTQREAVQRLENLLSQ